MEPMDDLKFEIQEEGSGSTQIKVVGVGGGGANAVARMMKAGVRGVEFHVMNTDAQALKTCPVPNKLALGMRITNGLGAGTDPEVGRQAALEDTDTIISILEGADMVFVAAGLGGGTGTGAAPVICSLARELGALTVAVVTRPFRFEGPRRQKVAEAGLAELASSVDCVITIQNDKLVDLLPPGTTYNKAFEYADDVLRQGVQGISDIMTTPGLINRDFADVRAIMSGMGFAMMGTATAKGKNAAVEAARRAMDSPLLEEGGIRGARAVLMNITAPGNLTIHELAEACELVQTAAQNDDLHMNFGLVPDDTMDDEVRVTVIATGFTRQQMLNRAGSSSFSVAAPASAPPLMVEPEPEQVVEYQITSEPIMDLDETPSRLDPEPLNFRQQAPPSPLYVGEEGFEFEDVETPAYLRRNKG